VRNEFQVARLTKRIAVDLGDGLTKTDIDIVVLDGSAEVYYQLKRSADAFGFGKNGLERAQAWVKKALKDLGEETNYSLVKYVKPDDVTVPPQIKNWFDDIAIQIEVINIPHLD